MLGLILDGQTGRVGAVQGIELCLYTVIPALLPFLALSGFLTGSSEGNRNGIIGKLFSLPPGCGDLWIPAFLGGYPAGAAGIAQAYRQGRIDQDNAQRLLAYCNNVGPAFLFGIVAPQLPGAWTGWKLWALQLYAAWVVSRLFPTAHTPEVQQKSTVAPKNILSLTAETMGKICVTVILFRILQAYIQKYLPLPEEAGILFQGMLELTGGCCRLSVLPEGWRIAAASGMMAMGGLCVWMQTKAVTQGLSLRFFALGKAIQTGICISGVLFPGGLLLPGALALLKKSSFSRQTGV